MEGEKRKREEDNGEIDGKRKTKRENVNAEAERQTQTVTVTVTEDEVEEFYAILRRVHVAVKYFENVNNNKGRRKLTDTRWWPRFEPEDFHELNGVNHINGGQIEEEGTGLDLNSDPSSS